MFAILFPNPADGLSYVRLVPAASIRAVDTDPEDYEAELGYWQLRPGDAEGRYWKCA
ncbi:MAG: hypothetical protein KIS91_05250 [Anaerolineae bacterium]|nr:hypothetical protein [Anaerolineae bacterium]